MYTYISWYIYVYISSDITNVSVGSVFYLSVTLCPTNENLTILTICDCHTYTHIHTHTHTHTHLHIYISWYYISCHVYKSTLCYVYVHTYHDTYIYISSFKVRSFRLLILWYSHLTPIYIIEKKLGGSLGHSWFPRETKSGVQKIQ